MGCVDVEPPLDVLEELPPAQGLGKRGGVGHALGYGRSGRSASCGEENEMDNSENGLWSVKKWGLGAYASSHKIATQSSHSVDRAGGEPKRLPSNFGYHD